MARDPHNPHELLIPAEVEDAARIARGRSRYFPPPTVSTTDGLVGVGGALTPDWLLDAYRHGIFPWPVWEDEPMLWWSPDPRAIIELNGLHISRRLLRSLRRQEFALTCDRAFQQVICGCASGSGREDNTWLTAEMIDAYLAMHDQGHAHSVEAWYQGELVGGVYGVAIGGLFSAESMFFARSNASKVALVHLVAHLRQRGYRLLDIQQWTPHTGRLGAREISRQDYLTRLAVAVELPVTFGSSLAGQWSAETEP